ncbi:putative cysteine-rich receptor-like protein kinase 20 [Hordeum vulgare]|nr:putative cysteine-rich receptor-like protein kinase 20 [Hordeum vulgare]
MPRSAGLTNAKWKADVDWRAAVTIDRRNRLIMKTTRDAAPEEEASSRSAIANERPIFSSQLAAKLDLLRTNVAAKKRNTDLTFLMGGGDTMTMDPQVKAWYLAEQNNLMLGPVTTASTPMEPNHQGRRPTRQR